jgi:hypothetical protein
LERRRFEAVHVVVIQIKSTEIEDQIVNIRLQLVEKGFIALERCVEFVEFF